MDRKVLRNLSYGMYLIGSKDDNRDVGFIANTVVQITSDPATIALSCNRDNYTNQAIKTSKKFSVSILKENTDPKTIGTFGYQSSKDINKYENIETIDLNGMPILKDSIGGITCDVIDVMETDTHTIFLGKVTDMKMIEESSPMTYKYYHEVLKGKSPKNAPTYVEETPKEEEQPKKKTIWKCSVCGYEVEMDELPADFVCPICGQPASVFEKIER